MLEPDKLYLVELFQRLMNRLTVNEEGAQASSRDYVFTPGTLILDDDVIYQLFFVTWRDPRPLTLVVPTARATFQAVLTEVGQKGIDGSRGVMAPETHDVVGFR